MYYCNVDDIKNILHSLRKQDGR